MGCFGPDAPDTPNYGQITRDTLQAQLDLYPDWIAAETQYAPQTTANSLRNLEQYLMGIPGTESTPATQQAVQGWRNTQTGELSTTQPNAQQAGGGSSSYLANRGGFGWTSPGSGRQQNAWEPYSWTTQTPGTTGTTGQRGFLDIYTKDILPALSEAEATAASSQRAADIGDVAALGPAMYQALRGYNPQQTQLMDTLNASAQQQAELGGRMTPEQQQAIQNSVMGQRSGMGWGYNPGDLASAAMQATGYSDELQQQRTAQAAQIASLMQAIYGDPFLAILGRPSTTAAMGQGIAQQGTQNQTGNVFNPESSYAGNIWNTGYNTSAMFKAMQPSTLQNVGAVSDLFGSFIGSVGGGMMCWVAREVYGNGDVRWVIFRDWLLTRAPWWLRGVYAAFGERFSRWIADKPRIKDLLRRWMNRAVNRQLEGR